MKDISERHPHITGVFGESLILYLLSKRNFECARFDYVGIDIYAKNKKTEQKIGVSVKCMTLTATKPSQGIKIEDIKKLEDACKTFDLVPYFAVVFDQQKYITAITFPTSEIDRICTTSQTKKRVNLRTEVFEKEYKLNPNVHFIRFRYDNDKWFI